MLPGGAAITARYRRFRAALPAVLAAAGVRPDEMVFADYANLVSAWLSAQRRARGARWPAGDAASWPASRSGLSVG